MARRQDASARLSGDRGAALVEAAMVLPFLALLIFGIVEIGFLIRSAAVTSSASRSGARLVAAQYGSARNSTEQLNVVDNAALTVEKDLASRGSSDTPLVLWIYRADANGFPGGGNFSSCTSPCFQYSWDSGTGHFVRTGGTWAAPVVCGQTHETVGVYVRMSHSPIGFSNFLGNVTLDEHTVMRLETPTPNNCPSGV